MKKMKLTLFASVLTLTLVSSSAFAIYTGEEQEDQVEGQPHTMTKMIGEPSLPTEDVQVPETNAEVEPISTITVTPESLVAPGEVEEVKEKDNFVLYVIGGLVALLAVSVLLLKRKK